jgi:hypothetical protein
MPKTAKPIIVSDVPAAHVDTLSKDLDGLLWPHSSSLVTALFVG